MSIHKFFETQYNYNNDEFPPMSFKIAGISYYQEKIKNVLLDQKLIMMKDPSNKYDKNAIKILYNNDIIGYVPKDYQKICLENIQTNLIVINKQSIRNITGIRVIPENFIKETNIY